MLGAAMQGRRLPFGNEVGTAEVRDRGNRVRVLWRFGPVENVAREFGLSYRVRGVITRQDSGDEGLVARSVPLRRRG